MKKVAFLFVVLLFLFAVSVRPAYAQSPVPPAPDFGSLAQAALTLFLGLVGFPAAVGGIVALLNKLFPSVVTPAVASWISFVANGLMFLAIAYLVFTGQSALVSAIDSAFGGLAKLVADIAILVGGFTVNLASTPFYAKHARNHVGRMAMALAPAK